MIVRGAFNVDGQPYNSGERKPLDIDVIQEPFAALVRAVLYRVPDVFCQARGELSASFHPDILHVFFFAYIY